MGQFGRGLSSNGSPGALAASYEEGADQLPYRWPLRPDAQAGVCPEKVSPTRTSRRGVSNPQELHRRQRCDLIVPQKTQTWRLSQRSSPTLSVGSHTPHETSIGRPCRRRQLRRTAHREGIPWAPWAVVSAVAVFWNSPLMAVVELAGPLKLEGSPKDTGSGRRSSRSPGCSERSLLLR